jgi:hypothetical protein
MFYNKLLVNVEPNFFISLGPWNFRDGPGNYMQVIPSYFEPGFSFYSVFFHFECYSMFSISLFQKTSC